GTIDIFTQLTNVTRIWDCGDALPLLGPECFQNFGASYDYCIVIKNDNIHPAWSVSLQPSGIGADVTVSPTGVNFNPPLLPDEMDTIEVTLFTNTAMPGDTAKLHLSLAGVTANQTRDWFCSNQDTLCLVLLPCPPDSTRECCTDYEAFCQEVENQISISIDSCKAIVQIGDLQECTEINDIFWGDGTSENGPFTNGDMPMHNYAADGIYVISWIVFERDAVGDICFEKLFQDTIQVFCEPIDSCQANFDWVLTEDCLKINLSSTTISSDNPTYEWLVEGIPIATTANTMWTAPDTGVYEICLVILEDTGCRDTFCQEIGIYDEIWPIIQCPSDVFRSVAACEGGVVVDFDLPFTADSCGVDSVWCDYESGHFFECGTTVVTCYVRDIYGHESGCSFNVTVNCECAQIVDTEIMCGDSATGYNFCIYVEKLNGANNGNCDFDIINNQQGISVNIDNVNWIHPDTAKITGTIGSTRPIPNYLDFSLGMQCICPSGDTTNCSLPVNFLTPCCDSIYVESQEVCYQDDQLLVPLNGSIDFSNIAQTIWYVSPAPCPATPFGGTPYQVTNGYADLLLLPNYLNGDVCIYAEVIMAKGPCKQLTSNLDIIEICQPVTCFMKDAAYCYSGTPIIPDPICIELDTNGQNCEYTIIWKDENGDTIPGENGLKYQPPAIDFMGAADACAYEVTYTAIINSVCGASSCTATIRLDNDNAAVGQLSLIYPSTAMPFCPGQDATIQYNPACVGEPPMWFWHESTDGINFTAIPSAGNQNPVYNTNRLFTTTWLMVTKQNGACTTLDSTMIKIEIKDTLSIAQFAATPLDACRTTGVSMSVDFNPCTAGTANSCDCDYTIDWYKDGQVIHTGNYTSSPANFNYTASVSNNDYGGNYYAVVNNNCCNESKKTTVVPIASPMQVAAFGPCFQCFEETVTLEGVVENAVGNCTYQWYQVVNGVETPVSGAVNLTMQTTQAGTYIFEATCGSCVQRATVSFEQCTDECELDVTPPMVICNAIVIGLNGGIAEVFPTDIDGGSVDNCGIASMSLDKTTFDCNDIGMNTVTLTVVDLKGNSSACVTTVLVQDNIGSCNCNGTDLQISGNPIVAGDYKASNIITANGTVGTNTAVTFQAGTNITLQPGFTVEPGANFAAIIAQCAATNFTETDFSKMNVDNTAILKEETVSLKVQPNPFRYQTTLVLNLSKSEIVNLKVFDQSGRMIKELLKDKALTTGKHEVLLTNDLLKGGLYYISFQTETEHLMKKAIVISDGGLGSKDDDD
ncbi:MAG: 3-coathanger stack domain-containing protein, partial [Saprospiraceae bacterium]